MRRRGEQKKNGLLFATNGAKGRLGGLGRHFRKTARRSQNTAWGRLEAPVGARKGDPNVGGNFWGSIPEGIDHQKKPPTFAGAVRRLLGAF